MLLPISFGSPSRGRAASQSIHRRNALPFSGILISLVVVGSRQVGRPNVLILRLPVDHLATLMMVLVVEAQHHLLKMELVEGLVRVVEVVLVANGATVEGLQVVSLGPLDRCSVKVQLVDPDILVQHVVAAAGVVVPTRALLPGAEVQLGRLRWPVSAASLVA